ncbi:MAG TPA: hypothetical protein VEK79_14055 [Thermoanaerobaculia bacterium]|nr:hypothetical protein [Thermoanaerobaculia bacterium]
MNLSRDAVLALQRHFLGALSAPARTWLEPLPSPPLIFAGRDIRPAPEGCELDLGNVVSPGHARSLLHVFSGDGEIRLVDQPSWLTSRWVDDTSLEVVIAHDVEREFRGALRFFAGDRVQELGVRMTARSSHPFAQFTFNGSPEPAAFDFGDDDRPYQLSIANATSIPLVVTFVDLPAFLRFEVDDQHRDGPLPGPFFERTAPFVVRLRPCLLGSQEGGLSIRTTDPRPELREIELRFAAKRMAAKPRVQVTAPRRVRLRADQTFTATAQLENWGRLPARTSSPAIPRFLEIRAWPVVPAASNGQAGSAQLPITIAPARLAPGAHTLRVAMRIEGGEPAAVDVPVAIDVLPPRNSLLRPQTVAALLALLLLTLLFIVARGAL